MIRGAAGGGRSDEYRDDGHDVRLPSELVAAIDAAVGAERRETFLIAAVREKLERRVKLLAAAERAAGSLKDVDIPGWETPEAAAAWVRGQRRSNDHWEEWTPPVETPNG